MTSYHHFSLQVSLTYQDSDVPGEKLWTMVEGPHDALKVTRGILFVDFIPIERVRCTHIEKTQIYGEKAHPCNNPAAIYYTRYQSEFDLCPGTLLLMPRCVHHRGTVDWKEVSLEELVDLQAVIQVMGE